MLQRIYNTNYFISELGEIYNEKTGKFLNGSLDKNGYRRFRLNGKNVSIHRMVMETLNPVEGMEKLEVNHINGIKTDNRLENLEWVTHSENMKHAISSSLTKNCHRVGELNSKAKLTEEDVKKIRLDSRSYRAIAEDYGVGKTAIADIKTYKSWTHIK